MHNIKVWDWRYRIGYDERLASNILRQISNLPGHEEYIYRKIYDYFYELISLESLLMNMSEFRGDKALEVMDYVLENKGNILPVPSLLEDYYLERVHALRQSNTIIYSLENLLKESVQDNYSAPFDLHELNEILYGNLYPFLLQLVNSRTSFEVKKEERIESFDVESNIHSLLEDIKGDVRLQKSYGSYCLAPYNTEVLEGVGFAEWCDKELMGCLFDNLIVFNSLGSFDRNNFKHAVYHEVYPGHGQFYNLVRKNDAFLDHGALEVIEGWATHAEWHTSNSSYAKNLKAIGKEFLAIVLSDKPWAAIISNLYSHIIELGYSRQYALKTISFYTQMPGFKSSYFLGALSIEVLLEKGLIENPKDIILGGDCVGSFFSKYNHLLE